MTGFADRVALVAVADGADRVAGTPGRQEDDTDQADAGDLYYGEMKMRCQAAAAPPLRRHDRRRLPRGTLLAHPLHLEVIRDGRDDLLRCAASLRGGTVTASAVRSSDSRHSSQRRRSGRPSSHMTCARQRTGTTPGRCRVGQRAASRRVELAQQRDGVDFRPGDAVRCAARCSTTVVKELRAPGGRSEGAD